MVLQKELEYFEREKSRLLAHYKGQFALIKGDELAGTYTTFAEAFEAGVRAFGNQPFLIRAVAEKGEITQYPALAVGMINTHS